MIVAHPINVVPQAGKTFTAASEEAMLALDASLGDVAVRTDLGVIYKLKTSDPAQLTSWQVIGVSDHGALDDLADDDHPHYLNIVRGDARYYTQSQIDTQLLSKADAGHTHQLIDLNQVPSSLGSAGQVLAVNEAGTGTEFIDPPEVGVFRDVEDTNALTSLDAQLGDQAVLVTGERYELVGEDATDPDNWHQIVMADEDGNVPVDKLIPRLIAADDDQAVPALGELSAIVDSVSAPTAIYGLTYGDGATVRGVPVGALNSSATVFVGANGTPSQNGTALLAAYDRAKTLTPNGSALAANNRAAVIVGPGVYDLGANALAMDTEFVDLIGLERESVLVLADEDVIAQTADDVLIAGMHLHTRWTGGFLEFHAAYSPSSNLSNTKLYRVRMSSDEGGYATSWNVIFAGLYVQCVSDDSSFLGYTNTSPTTQSLATGTFIECQGGDYSFGGNSVVSGTFIRCRAGDNSFGSASNALLSSEGVFVDCEAGDNSFGPDLGQNAILIRCRGGDDSFAGDGGLIEGKLYHCIGGTNCYGGNGGSIASTGRLYYCIGGADSLGGTVDGSAKILFCVVNDAEYTGGS